MDSRFANDDSRQNHSLTAKACDAKFGQLQLHTVSSGST